MKSSYELAMERMGGGDDKPLTDEQKQKIAEVDTKYKAKIAERKFSWKKPSDAQAQGNEEEIDLIRRQLNDEIADLEAKSESEKKKFDKAKFYFPSKL